MKSGLAAGHTLGRNRHFYPARGTIEVKVVVCFQLVTFARNEGIRHRGMVLAMSGAYRMGVCHARRSFTPAPCPVRPLGLGRLGRQAAFVPSQKVWLCNATFRPLGRWDGWDGK